MKEALQKCFFWTKGWPPEGESRYKNGKRRVTLLHSGNLLLRFLSGLLSTWMDLNKSQVWIQRTASGVAECSLRMISLIHSLYILVYYHRYIGTLRYEYILVNGHGKGAGNPSTHSTTASPEVMKISSFAYFLFWMGFGGLRSFSFLGFGVCVLLGFCGHDVVIPCLGWHTSVTLWKLVDIYIYMHIGSVSSESVGKHTMHGLFGVVLFWFVYILCHEHWQMHEVETATSNDNYIEA